ncbi:LysR substrate-binding domain-containing protein [Aquabacterium parvum]|uniref:LysR substrate-binding domain-containing protein n=1 Tax=Aquabacterium parvum TaxID=70584 RepID=UPI0022857E6D|nr:LysR substrate-binding domain-containing protein [Aquabacterium parvum]
MEWWDSRPGFVSTVWRRERMVVIVRPGHPWAAESTIPLKWLKSQILLGGEAATGTGRLLQQYAGADSAEFTVGMQLGSRPCKTATSSMNTDQTWQLGMVRTPRFVCNDAQFLGVLRT